MVAKPVMQCALSWVHVILFTFLGKRLLHYIVTRAFLTLFTLLVFLCSYVYAASGSVEPVKACVIARDVPLTAAVRAHIADCLGWQDNSALLLCRGLYAPIMSDTVDNSGALLVSADNVTLSQNGWSKLSGNVSVGQGARIAEGDLAYIYRDAKTNQVTKIKLLGNVHYTEPDKLIFANMVVLNPQDKSGKLTDILYRFDVKPAGAQLPAWGRAKFAKRLPNTDYVLHDTTYTTCAPKDNAWQLDAGELNLYTTKATGVAKHARLRMYDKTILYWPYISFPISKQRKSGFLIPIIGSSNIGGADLAWPYYWNIAPNYDATLVPHLYTKRGMMFGGTARYLTKQSTGYFTGNWLPGDRAYRNFLADNLALHPSFSGASTNRWAVLLHDNTQVSPQVHLGVHYNQVSDPYYPQDFSTNLLTMTQNQLLRQGDINYTNEHWFLSAMAQSYQTLHPINQSEVADVYERLPQLLAHATYADLPLHTNFEVLGQYDAFHWPQGMLLQPEGPRYYLNPKFSGSAQRSWGYVTPTIELVQNYYDLQDYGASYTRATFSRTIPRYGIDSGLFFERATSIVGESVTHTLEPRLSYLNVPFVDQTSIPVFDSGYMIFNYDQLFRNNRFSGFDRIGDANQLIYALSSRWLVDETGQEIASVSIGQIRYFADRRVQLCSNPNGNCADSPLRLGYTSPVSSASPIASRLNYRLSGRWSLRADYVWDPYTVATNNGSVNVNYQADVNKLLSFGYTYLVSGNVVARLNQILQSKPLNQVNIAYAWPLSDRISTLGIYGYNISERYNMMTFLGLQYDTCCFAVRLLGGSVFKSLSPDTVTPQYNNGVYLQILLKGLGSVANSDPSSTIHSYLPSYVDIF